MGCPRRAGHLPGRLLRAQRRRLRRVPPARPHQSGMIVRRGAKASGKSRHHGGSPSLPVDPTALPPGRPFCEPLHIGTLRRSRSPSASARRRRWTPCCLDASLVSTSKKSQQEGIATGRTAGRSTTGYSKGKLRSGTSTRREPYSSSSPHAATASSSVSKVGTSERRPTASRILLTVEFGRTRTSFPPPS